MHIKTLKKYGLLCVFDITQGKNMIILDKVDADKIKRLII